MVIAMSFFILSTPILAQTSDKKHGIGLGLGQTFLMGKFKKNGDNKIGLDLFYSYNASYSFDLLLGAHFSKHSFQEKEVDLKGFTMSIKGRAFDFDAFAPYVMGGLGFYQPQIDDGTQKSEAKYTFGFNAGIGADLKLNNEFTVGLMAQYHKPFDIKQDDMASVRGSYFKLLLTTMFHF